MEGMVILNRQEQRRLMVLNQVEKGMMGGREAAVVLGISLRRVSRLLSAYRKEGAGGLAHGNLGRKPHNTLAGALRKQVIDLAGSKYAGCNTQHLTELIGEREGVLLSRSTITGKQDRVFGEGIRCGLIPATAGERLVHALIV